MDNKINSIVEILRNSESVMVLTGAGISAESGISTFRGSEGLWEKFKVEDIATPSAFYKDSDLVWRWYSDRRKGMLEAKPNLGHIAIAKIESFFDDFLLVTQNIDNLHRRAGSKNLLEIHGNIFREFCINCSFVRASNECYDSTPKCPKCGAKLRPDVVWFGEQLPKKELELSFDFASRADTIIVIGTSAIVYPVAELPYVVKSSSGEVIEVNLTETPLTQIADVSILEKAGIVLPEILKLLRKQMD